MKKKFTQKGFIGPIGDDLPSLVAILLALTMFFAALNYSLTAYNEKITSFNKIKGVMDIGRKIIAKGLLQADDDAASLREEVNEIAESYGLKYCIKLENDVKCNPSSLSKCKLDWVKYSYLVAKEDSSGKINLVNLEVCGGE